MPIPVVLVSPATKMPEVVRMKIPSMVKEERIMRNVIGVLRGKDPDLSKQAVLYSAHLDHLGTNPKIEGDGIYNGADDDASGVTAVVTLADAFANMSQPPARSLLFMTFWGEESGLLGSKQFVETPSWPLANIVANVNIEMIGRPEGGTRGKIWMTGWQESDLGTIMRESAMRWGVEIFEHPKFSSMLYRSSDNWSFVQRGVVAHSFSAGSLHPDYHQPDDEWDRLEIPHMTQVIRGLMLGSLPLIDGSATPRHPAKETK
jgi:Zn-dependent M28 family amino/carboxypeptidase